MYWTICLFESPSGKLANLLLKALSKCWLVLTIKILPRRLPPQSAHWDMWEMFLEAVCGKRTPAAIRHPRVRSRRPLKPRAGKCAVQAQREKSRIRWFARFSLVHESTLQSWWWSTREIFLKEEGAEKLGWKASKNKPRRPLPFPGMISIKLTPQCAPRCIGLPWWLQIQGVFLTGAPLKITSFFR